MKKYFVLALALMAFAVAPVMADVALSGEYNYSAAWNTGDEIFVGATDKLELDAAAMIDDYNTFKFEFEDMDKSNDPTSAGLAGFSYAKVITDWGKYFGFAESGFGMTTTAGQFDVETKETSDFTEYGLEYGYAEVGTTAAIMTDMDINGMVMPYMGMAFDNMGTRTAYLLGTVVALDPVTAEVYWYGSDAALGEGSTLGLEAAYSAEVADGVVLNTSGAFQMIYSDLEEFDMGYGFGIGAEAYGATVNLSLNGFFLGSDAADVDDSSYALSQLGVDAAYDILEWLSINGGFLLAMGDYATNVTNDEGFLGAEFGINVKPGAVTYSLGYVVGNEDALTDAGTADEASAYSPITPNAAPAAGGIYFAVDLDY